MSVHPVIATLAKQATESHRELLNCIYARLIGTFWTCLTVVPKKKGSAY